MSDFFRDGDLVIDYRGYRVWIGEEEIRLSALRFRILTYLTRNAGRTLSPRDILKHAWEVNRYDVDVVKWHIARLRRELGDLPPQRIIYVRGFGYRYDRATPEEVSSKVARRQIHTSISRRRIRKTDARNCKQSRAPRVAPSTYELTSASMLSCLGWNGTGAD